MRLNILFFIDLGCEIYIKCPELIFKDEMQTKEGIDKQIHSFINKGILHENNGDRYLAGDNYDKAIRIIKLRYIREESIQMMCKTGIFLYSNGICHGAKHFHIKVLEVDPENLASNIELAAIYVDMEEETKVKKYYKNTTRKRDNSDEWLKYTKMLEKAGKVNEYKIGREIAAKLHRQEVVSTGKEPSMPVLIESIDALEDRIAILKDSAPGPASYKDPRKDVFGKPKTYTWADEMDKADPFGLRLHKLKRGESWAKSGAVSR